MAITVGILRGGANNHQTSSEEANALATDFISEGIVGSITNTSGVAPATGSFAVNAQGTPAMAVDVSAGVAYVTGTPTSQNSQTLRVKNSATESLAISANSSGSTKYDWIYVKLDPTNMADPNSGADNVGTIVASRSSSASTDDGTPPTYGYPIAVVTVSNGAVSITNGNIRDLRSASTVGNNTPNSTGWLTGLLPGVSSVTNNGNRSYSITFASSVASTLSPGMRLRINRVVAAPTQCADLESSSSQYFNDTSLTGITFTDDFVCGAWVKLESYGSAMSIISRFNGTSGWDFAINSSGQVVIVGYNGSGSNQRAVTSYQSIPLNKWVHVAAQLDMSAYTATPTTMYVMIDGVDVPGSLFSGGTNPTSLVQAGNLEIGARNGGLQPFDGKLAQVFVSSAKITQANVRLIMTQGLTTADTSTYSIASAYSLSNSLTDLNTTNANNLTAQNSAAATNADSPFANATGTPSGTTDVALVMAVSGSTATVQVPEGCTIPTSGGVSAVAYSTTANPYGWVADKGRWEVGAYTRVSAIKSAPVAGTYYSGATANGEWAFSLPVGAWQELGYRVNMSSINSTAVPAPQVSLSTTNNAITDVDYSMRAASPVTGAGSFDVQASYSKPANVSSATTYYLILASITASATQISLNGANSTTVIKAIPAGI